MVTINKMKTIKTIKTIKINKIYSLLFVLLAFFCSPYANACTMNWTTLQVQGGEDTGYIWLRYGSGAVVIYKSMPFQILAYDPNGRGITAGGRYYDANTGRYMVEGEKYWPYYATFDTSFINAQLGLNSVPDGSLLCFDKAPPPPVYVRTQTDDRGVACPAAQPSGSWIQRRSYQVWSDGSVRSDTGWYNVTYTCAAIKQSTQPQTRTLNCPSGQNGLITQYRTYDLWTDGTTKNFTAWSVTGNTCKLNAFTANTTKRKEACPEGYTGFKQYKWVIKYKDVSYQAVDADGKPITYTLSTPYEEEVLDTNTCTLIPSTTVSETNGSETISCDTYYNAVKGTYNGDVIKYGSYVSSYNSGTKQTTTLFVQKSSDISSCVSNAEKSLAYEERKAVCPVAGQTGEIIERRYYTLNADNSRNYLYGLDYFVFSNSCQGSDVDNSTPSTFTSKTSLLKNLSFTTSDISSNKNVSKAVFDNLAGSWTKEQNDQYSLNLVVDDLRAGVYNSSKVGAFVNSFKNIVGSNADVNIVSVPATLDKYLGNGGLTDIKDKHLSGAVLNGNKVDVSYIDLKAKGDDGLPAIKKFSVTLY